eukprot:scaffold5885_cov220-Pinguiococcus_pyrenoidosus.AAC.2
MYQVADEQQRGPQEIKEHLLGSISVWKEALSNDVTNQTHVCGQGAAGDIRNHLCLACVSQHCRKELAKAAGSGGAYGCRVQELFRFSREEMLELVDALQLPAGRCDL